MRVRIRFGAGSIELALFEILGETYPVLGDALVETGCKPREGSFERHSWDTGLGETLVLNLVKKLYAAIL